MKPVRVSVDVPQSRESVYDFLDVLANHELFTDHMMRNWQLDGPDRGVGARVKLDAVLGGRTDPVEIEVIEADPPVRNVERNVGAGGRRLGTGTYLLAELPDGGTRIEFEYAWQRAPLSERVAGPIVRRMMRSGLERSMQRLAEQLRTRELASP